MTGSLFTVLSYGSLCDAFSFPANDRTKSSVMVSYVLKMSSEDLRGCVLRFGVFIREEQETTNLRVFRLDGGGRSLIARMSLFTNRVGAP